MHPAIALRIFGNEIETADGIANFAHRRTVLILVHDGTQRLQKLQVLGAVSVVDMVLVVIGINRRSDIAVALFGRHSGVVA